MRLSGPHAAAIARNIVGELPKARVASHRSFHNAAGADLDSGLVLFFPGPHSFTGEDVVELHGHGGPVVVGMLVDAAIELGARMAEPGEFTRRAFLNDKLDLAQAEAIADLIESGTEQAARAALRSLTGAFSELVGRVAAKIERLRLFVEAAIDFPEEEIDFLSDQQLQPAIDETETAFAELIAQAKVGRVLRDGYRIVIVGKPNAGKSSLMNRLSGEETAIVTELAGTTRDILREQINIDGLAVELVDTAGLRNDPDRIEAEGIRRARKALQSADAVLWIQDASDPDDESLNEELPDDVPVVVVRNKIDLTDEGPGGDELDSDAVRMSAKTGAGLDELRTRIRRLAGYKDLGEQTVTARRRHVDAIRRARDHFETGRNALTEQKAGEVFAEELRLAHQALGEIVGTTSSDDLLGKIFTEFCIGK